MVLTEPVVLVVQVEGLELTQAAAAARMVPVVLARLMEWAVLEQQTQAVAVAVGVWLPMEVGLVAPASVLLFHFTQETLRAYPKRR